MTERLARMAWANLWRHPRRTLFGAGVIAAIAVGLAAEATVLVARPTLADAAAAWVLLLHAAAFAIAGGVAFGLMLASAFERRSEHAVLLAMGARPTQVALLMLVEVAALALLGLAAGVAIGLPILSLLAGGGEMPDEYVRSLIGLLIATLGAGLYPAVRAATEDPALLTRGDPP